MVLFKQDEEEIVMKNIKKLIAVLFATSLLFAGCGGKTEKKSGTTKGVKWPTKNVTVTIPYKAGGDTDLYCRLLCKKLGEKFKQNFVVVNMPGGGAMIAAKTVMSYKPDGYNMLFTHTGAALIAEATKFAKFSYTDDFTDVATAVEDKTYVALVKKSSGMKNLKDFIAYAKANPGKLRYAITYGSDNAYVLARMEETMGIKLNALDVGVGSANRMAAFIGNQADVLVVNYINARDYVEKGDFIPLGLCADKRVEGLDKIPTFKEQGYDIILTKKYEFRFPKGADKAIVDKLSSAVEGITKNPEFKKSLAKYYAAPYYRNAEQTAKEDKAEVAICSKYFDKQPKK